MSILDTTVHYYKWTIGLATKLEAIPSVSQGEELGNNSAVGGDFTNLGRHTPPVVLSFSFSLENLIHSVAISIAVAHLGTLHCVISFFHNENKNTLPALPPQMHISVYLLWAILLKKRIAVNAHFLLFIILKTSIVDTQDSVHMFRLSAHNLNPVAEKNHLDQKTTDQNIILSKGVLYSRNTKIGARTSFNK